jgi:putative ABC transport system substrate-binding protein
VQSGFVASLARPGGNITGLTNIIRELNGKRLELLKDLVPGASRVVVLYSKGVYDEAALGDVREAAQALRIEPQFLSVRGPEVLGSGFSLGGERPGRALIVLSDAVLFTHRRRVVELAAKSRLPAIYTHSGWVEVGGLMSYGTDFADLLRRSAYFVDKIVRGAKPADLPVEQPTKFELLINMKVARTLGLTIAPSLLLRADQVIE